VPFHPEPATPSRPRSLPAAVVALAGLAAALGCEAGYAPLPRLLPPNIAILARPAHGSEVDPTAADSIVLAFDRPMDPNSLLFVRSVSFLLPISISEPQGHWNAAHTRLAFHLGEFPVQPGATYRGVLAGLRTADGELYNAGSFEVLFRVRGVPDLFPLPPRAPLDSRPFCHRSGRVDGACTRLWVLESAAARPNEMTIDTRCDDCPRPERRDFYRRAEGLVEWVGFDLLDANGAATRSVRWPLPPPVLPDPVADGWDLEASPQTAADGTVLETWSTHDGGIDAPTRRVAGSSLPITVSFEGSRVLVLDWTVRAPGDVPERRRERWWLHPGVGLVQREVRGQRPGEPEAFEFETYEPPLSLISR
jgi:hypothetical protein